MAFILPASLVSKEAVMAILEYFGWFPYIYGIIYSLNIIVGVWVTFIGITYFSHIIRRGLLHGLAVVRLTTDHCHHVRISEWAYLKVVSSLTSLHYLWRSLGPYSHHVHKSGCKTSIIIIDHIIQN